MTITYSFTSLEAMADHFTTHAAELRKDAAWIEKQARRGWRQRAAKVKVEAATYEFVAHMLRNTKLEEARPR